MLQNRAIYACFQSLVETPLQLWEAGHKGVKMSKCAEVQGAASASEQ